MTKVHDESTRPLTRGDVSKSEYNFYEYEQNTLNTTILLTHIIIRVIVWSCVDVGSKPTNGLGEVHVVEMQRCVGRWCCLILCDEEVQKSSEHSGQSLSHTRNEIHDVTQINFVFSSFNRVMLFGSVKEVCVRFTATAFCM